MSRTSTSGWGQASNCRFAADAAPSRQGHRLRRKIQPLTRLQCGRCLNQMELQPGRVRSQVQCSKCFRQLRVPKVVRHPCSRCGAIGEYGAEQSGRRERCRQCGASIVIPIQVAQPRRRRRRRSRNRHGRRYHNRPNLLPTLISLGVSLLGLLICFRLLSRM